MFGCGSDEIIEFVDRFLRALEVAQCERSVIVRRAIVDGICRDIAVERDQRHVILIGKVVHQAAVQLVHFLPRVHECDQRKIGIIGKRIALHGMPVASMGFVHLTKLEMGVARVIIHLRLDVIVARGGKDLVVESQGACKIAKRGAGFGNFDLQIQAIVQARCRHGGAVGALRRRVITGFAQGIASILLDVSIQNARDAGAVRVIGIRCLLVLPQPFMGARHQERCARCIGGFWITGCEIGEGLQSPLVAFVCQFGPTHSPERSGFDRIIGRIVERRQILFACQIKVTEEQRLVAGIDPHDRLHSGQRRGGRQRCRRGWGSLRICGCGGWERDGNRERKALAGGDHKHEPQPGCFFKKIHANLITEENMGVSVLLRIVPQSCGVTELN